MKIEIDVEEFAQQIREGKGLSGKDGALTPLIKQLTEMTLQAELESHLAQDLTKNHKNGYTSKTMRTEHGTFELETPRDRNGSFNSFPRCTWECIREPKLPKTLNLQ